MILLVVVFAVTLLLTAVTWTVVQRTFASRDAAKVRARLVGKPAPKKDATAQPLFLGQEEGNGNLVASLLGKLNVDQALQRLVEQSGVNWASGQVVAFSLLAALVAFNAWWYFAPAGFQILACAVGPAAGALPTVFLKWKRKRRIFAFEAQFPDALQFIARAMRAGHAFSVSLEMLHKEFPEPLRGEFRRTFEEQNLGLPLDTALEKLAQRMPLLDVQFFVAAVILQKRTGGNLAEILDKLSSLIRERFKLRGQIRSISAQGRMSSMVLTGIPMVVAFMMWFVNREHMLFFVDDELGRMMAGMAVGFVVLGYFVMQQIVKIEV